MKLLLTNLYERIADYQVFNPKNLFTDYLDLT